MYQHCQNPFVIKTTAKERLSLPKTMFLGVETTFRHTFPSSDLQCLPPDDSRVLCANTGIRLLATHSLSLVEDSLEYLEFPLLKFNYFQCSSYLFP